MLPGTVSVAANHWLTSGDVTVTRKPDWDSYGDHLESAAPSITRKTNSEMSKLLQPSRSDATPESQGLWSLIGTSPSGGSTHSIMIRETELRIGRRAEMDLQIDLPVVSGFHAEVFQSNGNLYVRDAGSTNGTFVNGIRITLDARLRDGDSLEIGGTSFRVLRRGNAAAPARVLPPMTKTCFVNDAMESAGRRSLAQLLNGGSLTPCFQAIHDLGTSEVIGYEFLARSAYPGIETAGQLFGQSSKAGREIELSQFCRAQALHFSHLIHDQAPVFVNTHPLEPLLEAVLPQMIQLRSMYPERGIVLEIHEAASTEPELVQEFRQRLADVNIRLAFDDFGAGQARIREMISASADYIKFDPSLIRDLQRVSPEQRKFFASILHGIQSEGVLTVAEGVETEEMAQVCRDLGFELVQGYLFSRPTLMKSSLE